MEIAVHHNDLKLCRGLLAPARCETRVGKQRQPRAAELCLAVGLWTLFLVVTAGYTVAARAQNQESTEADPAPLDVSAAGTSTTSSTVLGGGRLGTNYLIGPDDVLSIDVFNVPDLRKTVRVSNDGTINVALLGDVKAVGLTAAQLRQELELKWGQKYLEKPQVSVFIREFHSQPVSVVGAVGKPGIYQVPGPRTLIEVLSAAGGPARNAGPKVVVERKGGFGTLELVDGMRLVDPEKLEIRLQRLFYAHEDALNMEIKPHDTIIISKAGIIYVVGEVKKPGGFRLEDQDSFTVLQSLAMAEGLNWSASKRRAEIIRREPDGSLTETRVDLGNILKGKGKDLELAADDVLFVPSSAGKVGGKRTAESVVGTLGLLVVYGRL